MWALRSFASYEVADASLYSRSLCYSLRSDEKARSWHLGRVGSWNLLGLLLGAWTLGASGELLEVALGLASVLKSLWRRSGVFPRFSRVLLEAIWRLRELSGRLSAGSRPAGLRDLQFVYRLTDKYLYFRFSAALRRAGFQRGQPFTTARVVLPPSWGEGTGLPSNDRLHAPLPSTQPCCV